MTLTTSCGGSTVEAGPVPVATPAAQQVAVSTPTPPPATPVDADTALTILKAGNERYVTGDNTCFNRITDRPQQLNQIQHPIASIVGCSDSRVDPNLAFDQSWGVLFGTRVAGNLADKGSLGSNEFAVTVLGAKLIVVLGHQSCGAVNAAIARAQVGGDLQSIIDAIIPAVDSVRNQPGDLTQNAIEANVRQSMANLLNNTVIGNAVSTGGVKIVGGVYMIETGVVHWLP